MKSEFLKIYITILSITLFGMAASAQAAERQISGDTFYGCTSKKDFEDIVRLHADGDTEAAKKLLGFGMSMGACTIFQQGEAVHTVKPGVLTVQVRRKGEPTAYWTAIEAIQ